MGLKVWLPLNGSLQDQGTAYTTFSGTPSWKTYGKIGNSALNLQNRITCNTPALSGIQFFSITFWVRIEENTESTANWMDVIGFTDQTSDNKNGQFRFETGYGNIAYSGVHWHDNTTDAIVSGSYTYNTGAEFNQWHHIAITVSDNEICSYYDGILKKMQTTNLNKGHLTGSWWLGESTTRGCIQDVRIYDYPLSIAEVKEISQGLVLHYKLDQNITVGENIMPNSLNMGLGSANSSTGTWRTAGSNSMTRSRVAIYDTPEGNGYGFQNSGIQTYNDGSCYGIDSFPMEANTDYIISMWARITSGTEGYAGFNVYSCTVTGGSWTQKMKNYYVTQLPANGAWTKCWMSYKTNAATTRNIYIGITTGDTDVTTQMCNVHIEKGIINNDNIIKDSSGYNHNGVCVDTTISSDNPRYNTCISCIGTATDSSSNTITGAQYFYCNMDMPAMNAITIAWWNKIIKYNRGGIFETSNSIQTNTTKGADHSTTAFANWDSAFGVYNGSTRVNIFSNFARDGEWHYHAITFDGANVKYYLDGILKQTSALTGNLPAWKSFCIGLGKAGGVWRQIQQNVSDFRIYCTSLLDEDIKQLYSVGMKIDNSGKIHTFELMETNNNILYDIELARTNNNFINGLSKYTQTNCQVTLIDGNYRIYRPPNLTVANNGNTMWGGLLINNQTTRVIAAYDASRDNVWDLQKNHTYIFAFHAKGQSSNSPSLVVESNMGWDRIAGVGPNPTYIASRTIPANFNGEQDCYIIFKIEDDIIKTATESKSAYVQGNEYLSYRDLCLNYGYTSTGALGTDLYLTDFRLYDITNAIGKINKIGTIQFNNFIQQLDKTQIRKLAAELIAADFIEK